MKQGSIKQIFELNEISEVRMGGFLDAPIKDKNPEPGQND